MDVDAGTQTFLNMLKTSGGRPFHQMTAVDARAAVVGLHQAIGGAGEPMHQVVDRRIPVIDGDITLRVYTPRAVAPGETLPIILQYHGGGFVAGDLDTHDVIARSYAKHADAIVISVDYRLAPEHKFPTAVEDCYAALGWAADHAAELGGDAQRLAVAGDSAGGTLATVVCQLAKARGGPAIGFQVLVYPSVDFHPAVDYVSRQQFGGGEYLLSNQDMDWFASNYLGNVSLESADPRVSPLRGDLTGLPPALVVTAGFDLLRDEGQHYADLLAAAGVPVEYRCFESTIHAFISFGGVIPTAQEGLAFVAERLRTALHRG